MATLPSLSGRVPQVKRPEKGTSKSWGVGKGSGNVFTTKLHFLGQENSGTSGMYYAHLGPYCRGIKTLLYHCCRWFKTTQHLPRASCHHSWLSSELPEGMTLGDKALHQESSHCPQAVGHSDLCVGDLFPSLSPSFPPSICVIDPCGDDQLPNSLSNILVSLSAH